MSRSLKRLARLRASLHRQSLHDLGEAERDLQRSHQTLDRIQADLRHRATNGQISAQLLKLLATSAANAADAVEVATSAREEISRAAQQKTVERRQVERLVEKAEKERRRQEKRREQGTTDTWVQHRWSVR